MRTNRPPTESILPFHPLSFFSNLSATYFHSEFLSFLWCIGIPKYLKGRAPISHPKIWEYSLPRSLASPKQNISLLWKLVLRPDNCSKAHSKSFMFLASSRSFSMKRIVSSAYCKIDKPLSTRFGTRPLINSVCFARSIKIAKISTTILKRIGDNGSPCLTPSLSESNVLYYHSLLYLLSLSLWLAGSKRSTYVRSLSNTAPVARKVISPCHKLFWSLT